MPGLQFTLSSPDLRIIIETAGFCVLLFAASTLLVPGKTDSSRDRNALVAALVALALSNVCFGVGAVVLFRESAADSGLTFYPWLVARVVAGVLFVLAAVGGPRLGLRTYLALALGAIALVDGLLLLVGSSLPEPASPSDRLVIVAVPAILFGVAASLMWRLFERGSSEVHLWLAAGLAVGVLTKAHEVLYPAVLGPGVTSADLVRSLIGALLLTGALVKVRQLAYHREAVVQAQLLDLGAQQELLASLREFAGREEAFRSIVVHELATPIATLRSFAHVLAAHFGSAPSPAARVALDGIDAESDRLHELVARMDELRRLEVDEFWCELRPAPLRGLINDAATYLRGLPGDHFVVVQSEDLVVSADPVRLGQALRNILTNAARYSPSGSTIRLEGHGVPGDLVHLAVVDRGPGIPPEERERVLRRYERGTARDRRGAGLGLYIAARIAEAHGGRLLIDAGVGGSGARVVLELRQAR